MPVLAELVCLSKNIEHIKSIVTEQLATASGGQRKRLVLERVNLSELLEDGLGVLKSTLAPTHDVVFVRRLESLAIETDRHKLFQIVMNLLTNARDAVVGCSGIITVETKRRADGKVEIVVTDNGLGVPLEIRDRIFTHGFTTKHTGHGFGLHSSACAAIELGGLLSVESAGPGQGASFTVTIPVTPTAQEPVVPT